MQPSPISYQKILVFLPETPATIIAEKLKDSGFAADAVFTIPTLEDALKSFDYGLVVTTRPEIDIVRRILPLSVINLEIFFHQNPALESLATGTKQFDTDAFLARVKALSEPRSTRRRNSNALPTFMSEPRRGPVMRLLVGWFDRARTRSR